MSDEAMTTAIHSLSLSVAILAAVLATWFAFWIGRK